MFKVGKKTDHHCITANIYMFKVTIKTLEKEVKYVYSKKILLHAS